MFKYVYLDFCIVIKNKRISIAHTYSFTIHQINDFLYTLNRKILFLDHTIRILHNCYVF